MLIKNENPNLCDTGGWRVINSYITIVYFVTFDVNSFTENAIECTVDIGELPETVIPYFYWKPEPTHKEVGPTLSRNKGVASRIFQSCREVKNKIGYPHKIY